MKSNIVLIGMMGSGKTTVGAELSKVLTDFQYVDIDAEIEKSTQKKISEIFLKHGEPFFSAGGGAFESEDNRKIMLDSANVIYLKATPEEIYTRIKNETHRPLLKKNFSIEKIANIIEMRKKNYEKANIIIDTNGKTPYDIVKEILGALNG